MPRHPKGSGKRPQSLERARTMNRKGMYYLAKWGSKYDKDEILGIAEGIMIDRSVNMKEAPYLLATKETVGNTKGYKKKEARLKHNALANAPKVDEASWSKRVYTPAHNRKRTVTIAK